MDRWLVKTSRLYDGLSSDVRPDAFVIIDGATIEAVGRQSELGAFSAGAFARTLDVGDVTLMPGLVNMHTHMSFSGGDSVFQDATHDTDAVKMIRSVENLRDALRTGVTTVRDCGTLPRIALPLRDAIDTGLLVGPRVIASGAITTTGGHCWYCATEADDEASVRRAVRAHVKDGVDFIKLFATGGNLTPGTNPLEPQFSAIELSGATEEARRLGRRTSAHAHGAEGIRRSIDARVTTIEHCSFQTERGIGWDGELARRVADSGIYVCHTIFRGIVKHENDPDFHFTPAQEAALAKRKDRLHLTRRLADVGVTLIAGNDAGVMYCDFKDFPEDLVLTAEGGGFSALEVIESATRVAAEALGRSDLGVLAPGKSADLLAVEGNPLEDIRAITRPRMVVAAGRIAHRGDGIGGLG